MGCRFTGFKFLGGEGGVDFEATSCTFCEFRRIGTSGAEDGGVGRWVAGFFCRIICTAAMLRPGIPSGFEIGTCTVSFGTVPECRTFCALLRLLGCNSVDFGSVADIGYFDDVDGFGPAEIKFSESFPQDKDSDNGNRKTEHTRLCRKSFTTFSSTVALGTPLD